MTRNLSARDPLVMPPLCRNSHEWWVAPADAIRPGVGILPAVCVRCWRVRGFRRHHADLTRKEWQMAVMEEGKLREGGRTV